MKVVLRHQTTGRYYHSPGQWVRRADNALTFEDASVALQFCRTYCLADTQPVHRMAPYLMTLLARSECQTWKPAGNRFRIEDTEKFIRN